jgi:uncharacterized cupredoxin-like copper-binding protein
MMIQGKALRQALLAACMAGIVAACSSSRAATSSVSFQVTASVPATCTTLIVPVLAQEPDAGKNAVRIACRAGQTYSTSANNSANISPYFPARPQIAVVQPSVPQNLTVVTVTY